MTNEKKLYMYEQLAQKAWTLSLNFMQAAGFAGESGRGYAIVAHEMRNFANHMSDYSAKLKFETGDQNMFERINELAFQMGYIAANAVLEVARTEWFYDKTNNKGVAVLAHEIHDLALSLNELGGKSLWQQPYVIPEIMSPVKTSLKSDEFLRFTISGISLAENVLQVEELLYYPKTSFESGTFELRGTKMPVVNCYKKLGLPYIPGYQPDRQAVAIINPDYTSIAFGGVSSGINIVAVPIDDLDINALFSSRIATAVPPKENNALTPYSRECWDVVGDDQLMFIDWQKLI